MASRKGDAANDLATKGSTAVKRQPSSWTNLEGFVMGKTIWEGWREPDDDTPQLVSIVTGANLRPVPRPRGVPLDDLESALKPTTLRASREGDTLVVRHERLVSRVGVVPPATPEPEDGPISAERLNINPR